MLLIVGLGNPGRKFSQTRHNIGFRVLERLAERLRLPWRTIESRTVAVAESNLPNETLTLAKPLQFMNNSGGAVARLTKKLRLPASRLWVVVDDIDLPFGTLRLRTKGSSGGHHGLDSVIERLGASDFPRLRIGVGPTEKRAGFDGAAYVLHPFTPHERRWLPDVIDRAVDALTLGIERGFETAMNLWNRKGAKRLRP